MSRLRIVALRHPLHLPREMAQVGLRGLERPGHEAARRAPPGKLAPRQGVGVGPDFRRRAAQLGKPALAGQVLQFLFVPARVHEYGAEQPDRLFRRVGVHAAPSTGHTSKRQVRSPVPQQSTSRAAQERPVKKVNSAATKPSS